MNIEKQYQIINKCRISDSKNIKKILNLGIHPLANSLKETRDKVEKIFPLSISYCSDSSLLQLNQTISKEILFEKYLWVTGTSLMTLKYIDLFVDRVIKNVRLKKNDYIVEIASNDGTLLKGFIKKGYNNVLGIDPAKNLSELANQSGIKTMPKFWTTSLASEIVKENDYANIIIARNVIPHVSDILDVISGIYFCLKEDGVGIIEFHDASIMQQELHYDYIYHEHLCYFSIQSLTYLLNQNKLYPFHIEKSPISGGSYVIYFTKHQKEKTRDLVNAISFDKNNKINDYNSWLNFASKTIDHQKQTINILKSLQGKKIVGFGSSARSQTYLNYCGIDYKQILTIIDNNSLKQNLYTPGSSIPIVSFEKGMSILPDIIFILAWNFKDEIIKQCNDYGFKGNYLIAFPKKIVLI